MLLALGNSSSAGPVPGLGAGEVIGNAWNLNWIEKLPTYVPRVLLIGSGLTMIDIALAVADQRPDTRILAISRHGLLPQPHADSHSTDPRRQVRCAGAARRTGRCMCVCVSSAAPARRRRLAHGDPERARSDARALAVGAARTPRPVPAASARLVGRAPASCAARRRSRASRSSARTGNLQLEAGRIVGTRRIKDGTVVSWRPRGGSKLREELVDVVVNVTGPNSDPRRATCPLVSHC